MKSQTLAHIQFGEAHTQQSQHSFRRSIDRYLLTDKQHQPSQFYYWFHHVELR